MNNNDPKIDHWGTPLSIVFQLEENSLFDFVVIY